MKESRQGIYLELWTEMARVWLRVWHGFGSPKIRVGADFCSTLVHVLLESSLLQKQLWHTKIGPKLAAPFLLQSKPNLALEFGEIGRAHV